MYIKKSLTNTKTKNIVYEMTPTETLHTRLTAILRFCFEKGISFIATFLFIQTKNRIQSSQYFILLPTCRHQHMKIESISKPAMKFPQNVTIK